MLGLYNKKDIKNYIKSKINIKIYLLSKAIHIKLLFDKKIL
jgi:hypothetical protein